MGYALDRVIDIANAHQGKWSWDPFPSVKGWVEVHMTIPGRTEPLDGMPGPCLDESALALLLAHFPAQVANDPTLAMLAGDRLGVPEAA